MPGVSVLFFLTGAFLALVGTLWGLHMGISEDHTLAAAHGHLNLVGFVSMSVFGAYYGLNRGGAEGLMAKAHFGLALISVVIFVVGMVLVLSGEGNGLVKLGSVLVILNFAFFVLVVARNGLRRT